MTKIIKHQFSFSHPADTVWEYLTNRELLALWLMKNDFEPVVGHEFQFRTGPIPALDFDGIAYCKVLKIVPLKQLSYTWNGGPGNGKITMESVVTWSLESTENGTDLYLEHSGFAKEENLEFYKGMLHGWTVKLEKFATMINAGTYGNTKA
jgi:uncharacterized protein YndB with AHSA1/START domain